MKMNWFALNCVRFLCVRPKPMSYKGKEVKNVFHLQTPGDANSIAKLANNKNAVIVGTSFVGEKKTLQYYVSKVQPGTKSLNTSHPRVSMCTAPSIPIKSQRSRKILALTATHSLQAQ